MALPPGSGNNEHPSTYVVQDKENREELLRLTLQDQLLTASMGGALSESFRPAALLRVLDVACGTGGWVIEAAQTYPEMSLVGIDISQRMITYAREQARKAGVEERIEFATMDALRMLEFPDASFDMVNMRLGGSFLRTWDWAKIIEEMLRVTCSGGIIRLIDQEIMHQSNSPATMRLNQMVMCAFYRAGHLFTEDTTGLVGQLPLLLERYGCVDVQTKTYQLMYQAGTEAGEKYSEDMARASQTLRPFVQKWGCASDDYDTLYQQSLVERRAPDFRATWNFLCVWGTRP